MGNGVKKLNDGVKKYSMNDGVKKLIQHETNHTPTDFLDKDQFYNGFVYFTVIIPNCAYYNLLYRHCL